MRRFVLLVFLLATAGRLNAQTKNFEMYFVDVEGGAATLMVSPSGESMLIDTGFPNDDRDAKRIYAATQLAGIKKIDHLLISHYHADHVGGLTALLKMIPADHFYDHGDGIEPENVQWLNAEKAASAGKRTIVKPGDTIPFKGVKVEVVTSDMKVIAKPLPGAAPGPNPMCKNAEEKAPVTPENQRVVGVLITYNKFRYLNLIDIDWEKDMELACPVDKIGPVTMYQTSRHGSLDGAGSPPFLWAIRPQVIIVNNGPRKGLGQKDPPKSLTPPGETRAPYEQVSYLRLAQTPRVEGIWQGHLSLMDSDPKHNTSPDMIANFEETKDCKGNWLKASVAADGTFTVTNGRNMYSKTYVTK
jgi:beta-lactamase superfamily II metal-dependent hydrolase